MSTIVKEVYDAFREAGVSEEAATGAAQAVFSGIKNRFDRVSDWLDEIDRRIARVNADLRVVKWMIELVFVVVVLLMLKGYLA